jgi:hypothetical protein
VKGYAVTDNAFTVKFKIKQDRQCTCNVTWGAFAKPLLPWKSNKYYTYMNGSVYGGLCMRVCSCSHAYPARNSYTPYFDVICRTSSSTIFFDIIS